MGLNYNKNTIFFFIYVHIISACLGQKGALVSKMLRTTSLDGWQFEIPVGRKLAGLEDHLGPETSLLTWLISHLHG